MASNPPAPDWRDETAYMPLLGVDSDLMAWEWLRRDQDYRTAARANLRRLGGAPAMMAAQAEAGKWGLHAFEDPDLPAIAARPIWRSDWRNGVLAARAEDAGPPAERFDLMRFADLASVSREAGGREHILLCDGASCLRLDIEAGTLLRGPMRLAYYLAGLEKIVEPLGALARLLRLWRTGRLEHSPPARSRNRRLVTFLRAHDAVMKGATQRDIAAALLARDPLPRRWRTEAPSIRSQAQRLVHGAAAMAAGGYRALLGR